MQPKAAKKIGGMTPKKMTGGQDKEEVVNFDGTDYTIKKTQEKDKLTICVSADMPTGAMQPPTEEGTKPAAAEGAAEGDAAAAAKPAAAASNAKAEFINPDAKEFNLNEALEREKLEKKEFGGKKKRKSSKKRKSMKKKGGMRKSMKVKA